MKFKMNISTKFAIFAAIAIIALTATTTYSNYLDQKEYFEAKLNKQIKFYSQVLNAYIDNKENLQNNSNTTKAINRLMMDNPEVKSINIVLINNGSLLIINSNDEDRINTSSDYYTSSVEAIFDNENYISRLGESYNYISIVPVSEGISGNCIGTYELIVSAENDHRNLEARLNNILLMEFFFAFFILLFLLIIVRVTVQKKVVNLKNAANDLRKGNLDVKVDINSRDEMGELANTFNEMAKDLKESRDKIEDYNKILEKLIDRKDEYIGQLGHDLKNPLQSLIGLLPVLIQEEQDPKKKEALRVMNKDAGYMLHLIIDTLELAKLRTDRIEFDFKQLNLKQVADEVIETQIPFLRRGNLTIENNIGDNFFVWADELRIKEVFNNLISNTIKYAKKEGGKITIKSERLENEIKISMSDQGIGMTEEQLTKVFDEFYTADNEVYTEDKGIGGQQSTGLGLAICKRIIEKHGGKIWAESKGLGMGSMFFFTLKRYDKIEKE